MCDLNYNGPCQHQILLPVLPFIDGRVLQSLLDPMSLIKAMESGFSSGMMAPARSHVSIPSGHAAPDTLLMMPAWNDDVLGIKLATIHPANGEMGLPAVHASYALKDRRTGQDLALLDGGMLTRLRTAATSALASSFLSRSDASCLLMVGAGSLAVPLIEAHKAVRPISRVLLWNRNRDRAEDLASGTDIPITIVDDLSSACSQADIISCATLSTSALILGDTVEPGTHVDLVGAYRPDMRESDSTLIRKASVFVDTHEGASHEAGDLLLAEQESEWSFDCVQADLAALCQRKHAGRTSEDQVTVFKSVGASLEDLVAASLAWKRFNTSS